MKILFVFAHSGLTRHFHHVMRNAAIDGHSVYVAIAKEKKGLTSHTMQEILSYSNVHEVKFVASKSFWAPLLRVTRGILDCSLYMRSDHPSPNLAQRYRKTLPSGLFNLLRLSWCQRIVYTPFFQKMLRAVERAAPPPKAICNHLNKLKPDVVLTAPYLFPNSEDIDYIKAARYLKIPTCGAIVSWDNLTTKGTGHVDVDKLFVWNDELKTEAVALHGFNPAVISITGAPTFDHLFDWKPTLTRNEFCDSSGIPREPKYLLYLCSSGSISNNEAGVVLKFAEALANNPETANVFLVVRPHPLNFRIWGKIDDLPSNMLVYPKHGDLPDNPDSIAIYCHTIHFASAMIGLNTSAFLEASVLDRPCIALPDLEGCYDRAQFGHFRHLEHGEFIQAASSFKEAVDWASDILSGKDIALAKRQQFVRSFIRPAGIRREASAVMLEQLLETGRITNVVQQSLIPGALENKAANRVLHFGEHAAKKGKSGVETSGPQQKSVVFVSLGFAHFQYYETVISALCRAGLKVYLAILKHGAFEQLTSYKPKGSNSDQVTELLESIKSFQEAHPNLQVLNLHKNELQTPVLSSNVRFLRSYASYVQRVAKDNFYRRRWHNYMSAFLQKVVDVKAVAWMLKFKRFEQFLGLIDEVTPANKYIKPRLKQLNPDMVIVCPGDMRYNPEVEWLKAAKKLGIKTSVVTLSWDNLTTKGLIHIRPDYLFVWNKKHAVEAKKIHRIPSDSIFVTGAPFFDKWQHIDYLEQDRDSFCASLGLDPNRAYFVYLGSSANIADNESWMIREIHAALINSPDPAINKIQMLVRPHPGNKKICTDLVDLPIVLTSEEDASTPYSENRKRKLFNVLHHSLLTVSINTSAVIDAIAIGKPCISVRSDRYQDTHVKSAHFRHLLDAGTVLMADSVDDCINLIGEHLYGADPSRERRQEFTRQFIRSPLTSKDAGETIAWLSEAIIEGNSTDAIKRKIRHEVGKTKNIASESL